MKLKNHNKNNTYEIDSYVMRGTIEMSPSEWQKSYLYLWEQYKKAIKSIDTYKRDSLSSLKKDTGLLFSVGILATQLIVKKYKLKNYKDQNYGIQIIYSYE